MNDFATYVGVSTLGSFSVLLVLWLVQMWFLTRLKDSIKHEYDTKLEEHKYEIEKRKKAEMVAKLLAHWISEPEDREELNRMAFECYLWLPDEIARNLADLLARQREDNVSVKTVLIEIRKFLNKYDPDYASLTNEDLTHFNHKKVE